MRHKLVDSKHYYREDLYRNATVVAQTQQVYESKMKSNGRWPTRRLSLRFQLLTNGI